MSPITPQLLSAREVFNSSQPSLNIKDQWEHPGDVFAVLLLLGGDVISRAIAQLAGGWVTPVAFSFGWVSYAITALLTVVGENKLMPQSDVACKVINGRNGYIRDNTSWVIGRLVRDYEKWQDEEVKSCLKGVLDAKEKELKTRGVDCQKPVHAGLIVSIYNAGTPVKIPVADWVYYSGFATSILQLGIAAIPCGLHGDWGVLMVTACGITLAFTTGSLQQWRSEKWACRTMQHVESGKEKRVVMTRGNGSQHAIVIIGSEGCLDLEDLSVGATNADFSTSWLTRITLSIIAILWILLLITADGLKDHTWYLLAVGGVGMVQNVVSAGARREPSAFGVPMKIERVIGKTKVMETLFAVDEEYKGLGHSMLDIFFPGGHLREEERVRWEDLAKREE